MLTILIAAAVFISVTALVIGVASFLPGKNTSQVEDRLAILTGSGTTLNKKAAAQPSLLSAPLEETTGLLERFTLRFVSFKTLLEQADMSITPSNFLGLAALMAVGGFLVAPILRLPIYLGPVFAAMNGGLPLIFLWFKRKKRLSSFAKQLPEALELVSRALRAGHSLAAGIGLVSTEMHDPIRKEFARCFEEQNFGIPLDEALEGMTVRVPNLDLRFFVTAVTLQRQTGGDLAEILDKIGYLVRERFRIWGQVQALTGEGRLSGIVLLALPPLLFVTMYTLNPEYCMILFNDPMGHKMLAVAVIMQVVGALVIRKIVNIKV